MSFPTIRADGGTFMKSIRDVFDIDAQLQEMEARQERERAFNRRHLMDAEDIRSRASSADPARFNVISLAAWIALAERAGVEHIPVREIHRVPARIYIDAMGQNPDAQAMMDAAEEAIIAGIGADDMLRFDQVAPGEIKAARSEGSGMGDGTFLNPQTGKRMLCIYEDRFYTTMMDHGGDDIIAFARPRMEPVFIDGTFRGQEGRWPAEFRVFVESGRVVGISNYYPQVSMCPDRFAGAAQDAIEKAERMLETMQDLRVGVGNGRLCPDTGALPGEDRPAWMPEPWASQDFTLDFFAVSETATLFLEGGPAGMRAAHPCCFLQGGREVGPDFLHGAAFSLEGKIRPLSDIAAIHIAKMRDEHDA